MDSRIPQAPSLEQQLQATLQNRASKSKLRVLKKSAPHSVDFSSNDFLSLSRNKGFQSDYLEELSRRLGDRHTPGNVSAGQVNKDADTSSTSETRLGSTGSRLLDGNSYLAEGLEREIASFHGAPAALLVNSGFDANVSIFSCVPQPGDIVVYDELIHASVHDGMKASRLAKSSCVSFKHNDVESLREKLAPYKSAPGNVFVAVESVYSMDGDLAPLREIVDVLHEIFPRGNGYLIVDEAHSTGVCGLRGRGRVAELGLENDPALLVRLHTFGKALAANGAVILCSHVVRTYLINYARPVIYSTFMSTPMLVAVQVAYAWLRAGKTQRLARDLEELQRNLWWGLERIIAEAKVLGLENESVQLDLRLLHKEPLSPILALLTKRPKELAAWCQERGFVVRAVMSPTVPRGTERVRICLHSGNTLDEVQRLLDCIRGWVQKEHEGPKVTVRDFERLNEAGQAEQMQAKL